MKNLILIFHASLQQELADTLRSLTNILNFTFTQTEGHKSGIATPFFSERDLVVGFSPFVRADILLNDDAVAPVLAALRSTVSGLSEQGTYWVIDIEKYGQF